MAHFPRDTDRAVGPRVAVRRRATLTSRRGLDRGSKVAVAGQGGPQFVPLEDDRPRGHDRDAGRGGDGWGRTADQPKTSPGWTVRIVRSSPPGRRIRMATRPSTTTPSACTGLAFPKDERRRPGFRRSARGQPRRWRAARRWAPNQVVSSRAARAGLAMTKWCWPGPGGREGHRSRFDVTVGRRRWTGQGHAAHEVQPNLGSPTVAKGTPT